MTGPNLKEREQTLELLNSEYSQRLALHSSLSSSTDTKATFFIGFAAIAVQVLLSQNRTGPWDAIAFAMFVITAAAGVACIALREYKVAPNPETVDKYYNEYIKDPNAQPNLTENVLARLVAAKSDAILKNKKRDKSKVRSWWLMVVAFALAIAFSIVSVTEVPSGCRTRSARPGAARAAACT